MKYEDYLRNIFLILIVSIILLMMFGCKSKTTVITETKYDTIFIDRVFVDTIIDSTYINKCDSLESELFVANYKFNRIKSYCDIVGKNKTQLKYLRGWILRVVNEE